MTAADAESPTMPFTSIGEWRPIETAPKTPLDELSYGPKILLYVDEHLGVGFWDQDFNKFYVEYPEAHRGEPTHWMPLPDPPR